MPTGAEIREALHAGRKVFSTAAIAPSTYWPQFIKETGIDFVFIDTEHVPLSRETVAWMCRTYDALGVPPVVRIPCNDLYEASKVLDGGARGVIGPYLETVEQARAIVGAARWRPLKGRRLEEALDDASVLEPELRAYLEKRNADTLCIANIESVAAIENLAEIARTPGLDAVLIGPHDLSCSLGIPEQYDHARFDEAVQTIFRVAREAGIGAGIHYWESVEREIEWAQAGGNLIMHSSDITMMKQTLANDMARLRKALS
ncbi:HpcH/HpaI aldolase family protein [Lignipirellula cremea]|uniref:4-hydroxy-2-oxo-heptane-1,7-dioate aldolase n=1 Tax=Lignipirellula cremea TaxID=2528010 RepID=A0A518DMB6_9BACT|nr:aldolase/citrate lyase family protein [Lignipirellula cremea]QDU92962.1 4-hydroxy-2-oxo-heptane-1,7-dioate aldolase [Lignipirellula cremea]